jgi:hypothetical protein
MIARDGAGMVSTRVLGLGALSARCCTSRRWRTRRSRSFACFQRGLQIGPAVPVIAVMTGATNGVAIVIGLLVFGESLGVAPAFAVMHIVAFAFAVAAGLMLARAQGRLAQ